MKISNISAGNMKKIGSNANFEDSRNNICHFLESNFEFLEKNLRGLKSQKIRV